MKRRLISTLLCAAVMASFSVMPVSASSLSYSDVTFDESAWSTTNFDANVSFTDDDGTEVLISNAATKSVTDSGFVAGNTAGNKYLQLVNTGSSAAQPILKIQPATPLTEDFAVEFDYAVDGLGTSYERVFNSTFHPIHPTSGVIREGGHETQVFLLRNGDAAHMISGKSYGTYAKDKKFEKVKIVTKFHESGVPTFDVYINGSLKVENLSYATPQYYDYSKGIGEIRIAPRVGTGGATHIAFDNIKIYDVAVPKYNGTFDFEANQYSQLDRQKDSGVTTGDTLKFEDGTVLYTQRTSNSGSSSITMTDDGFVENNVSGNTYMQIEYEGDEGSGKNPGNFSFVPNTAFTEDFIMDFKFAIDTNYPYGGYVASGKTAYWPVNAPTMTLKVFPAGRSGLTSGDYGTDNYSSRTLSFGGANSYFFTQPNNNGSSAWMQPSEAQIKYVSGKQFEDVRVIFKNVTSAAPVYSAYRKHAGSDYYELIAADIPLSTKNYAGGSYHPDYASGLKAIKFEFFDVDSYLTSDFYVKIAIDDVKFTKLNQDRIDFSNVSAKLENGKYYPEVTATSYYEGEKTVQVITAVYDANGMMTDKEIKPLTLTNGVPASVVSEGVTEAQGGYARVYVVDTLATLNNVVDYYTTE